MESELPGDREVYYLQQWRLNSTKLIHKPLKRWFHQLSLTNHDKRTETLKEAFSPPLRPRRTPSLCLLCSCDHKKATTRPRHSELLSPRPKITISWKTVNLWSCQNKQLPSNTMMCHSHFSCSVCHFRSNEDLKLLFSEWLWVQHQINSGCGFQSASVLVCVWQPACRPVNTGVKRAAGQRLVCWFEWSNEEEASSRCLWHLCSLDLDWRRSSKISDGDRSDSVLDAPLWPGYDPSTSLFEEEKQKPPRTNNFCLLIKTGPLLI